MTENNLAKLLTREEEQYNAFITQIKKYQEKSIEFFQLTTIDELNDWRRIDITKYIDFIIQVNLQQGFFPDHFLANKMKELNIPDSISQWQVSISKIENAFARLQEKDLTIFKHFKILAIFLFVESKIKIEVYKSLTDFSSNEISPLNKMENHLRNLSRRQKYKDGKKMIFKNEFELSMNKQIIILNSKFSSLTDETFPKKNISIPLLKGETETIYLKGIIELLTLSNEMTPPKLALAILPLLRLFLKDKYYIMTELEFDTQDALYSVNYGRYVDKALRKIRQSR